MSATKKISVSLLLLAAVLLPAPSFADSLLTDHVNFSFLANGALFGGVGWPGHATNVEVVSGGAPEYDYFGLGVVQIDVDADFIRFFIPTSSVGWANLGGFTGIEVSDLDWPDLPAGGHLTGIGVSIINPWLVNQSGGAPVPYSAGLVTFGNDWVRIPTGGYDMFAGFQVLVQLQTAPNVVPEPATLMLLGLGAGSVAARRLRKTRRSATR